MACPNLDKCPIFEGIQHGFLDKVLMRNYCNGDFSKCARKKLKDSGKVVPFELLPNGNVLEHLNGRYY